MKNYLYRKNPDSGVPYLAVVHRLDQPVEGLLVFARTPRAAAELSRQSAEKQMEKTYLAVLCNVDKYPQNIPNVENGCGKTRGKCGKVGGKLDRMRGFSVEERKENRSEIVKKTRPGAKKAVLRYRLLKCVDNLGMAEIRLETGRHHQIRVQMAGRGTPLLGDRKYGKVENYVDNVDNPFPALCAYRLRFRHPVTGKWMEFQKNPQNPAFQRFM